MATNLLLKNCALQIEGYHSLCWNYLQEAHRNTHEVFIGLGFNSRRKRFKLILYFIFNFLLSDFNQSQDESESL